MSEKKFKLNDRVKRTSMQGCYGCVKDVREDVTATNADAKEKGVLIQVFWDNGTLSYMSPEALEIAKG